MKQHLRVSAALLAGFFSLCLLTGCSGSTSSSSSSTSSSEDSSSSESTASTNFSSSEGSLSQDIIGELTYIGSSSLVLDLYEPDTDITDYTDTVVALLCISMPTFFLATLLKLIFSIKLGWFDLIGMQSRDYMLLSDFGKFLDLCHHMVLPVITLTMLGIGGLMRYTRTNMLEVLNSDYIRTARAKGLSERTVINRHAFRNTLIPLITIMGTTLPALFSGALITETLFGIRGIGYTSYYAMINGDIPFTMFYLAFISILTLLSNLLADVLYAVVDPRVRVH